MRFGDLLAKEADASKLSPAEIDELRRKANSAEASAATVMSWEGGVPVVGLQHHNFLGLGDDDHTQYLKEQPAANEVWNESGADYDLRFEGDTNANLLYLDAGNNRIGIGTATPSTDLHVYGSAAVLALESSTVTAPTLYIKSQRAAATDTGYVSFYGLNDAATPETINYARVEGVITDVTDGSEDGRLEFAVMIAGTLAATVDFDSTETVFNPNSRPIDFRVESDDNENMFFIHGNNNQVGVGGVPTDGTLHVLTATAGTVAASTSADDLVIENSTYAGISILAPADSISSIFFGSPSDNDAGQIQYFHASHPSTPTEWQLSASAVGLLKLSTAAVVFNDDSNDVDFRVESNTNANAIFVDAGNDRVGILNAAPSTALDVTGTVTATTFAGGNVTSGADPGHTHTGASLGTIDISDDTNLAATSPIVLTGDTLSHAATSGNIHVPAAGASTQLLQYSSAGTAKWVTMSGDATIADGGAVTIDHGGLDGLGDDDHTQYVLRQPAADVVINESGGDFDLRIEGDTNANLLFVDGGANRVGIGCVPAIGTLELLDTGSLVFNYAQASAQYFTLLPASSTILRLTSAVTAGVLQLYGNSLPYAITIYDGELANIVLDADAGGKVGIGTGSPAWSLHALSSATDCVLALQQSGADTLDLYVAFLVTAEIVWDIGVDCGDSNAFKIAVGGNWNNYGGTGVMSISTAGNAWFLADVSALTFTDRTEYPKSIQQAYDAVLSLQPKDGKLDHDKLDPFVKAKAGEGRDLSALVSAQNEVIKDLIARIETLEA